MAFLNEMARHAELNFRILFSVLLLIAALKSQHVLATEVADWWESASLYQIYPRSFQDSDGDGVGHLNGTTSRLEYLKEIGITATWLSPVFESPMADFGYDISNFTRIDAIFGTLEDFDEMIAKAKRLGLKIILDFVPNHSSDECEWFQKSVEREAGFEEFYIWEDGLINTNNASARLAPSNWVSIFGGYMWTWHPKRSQFYLHQFLDKQPDLNFSNPLVRAKMLEVLKFWLDRGVDGFRIDAVPHISEKRNADGTYPDEPVSGWSNDPNSYGYHKHIYTKDQFATIEVLYEWNQFLLDYVKSNGGETRVLLAEAYSPVDVLSQYFSNGTHFGTQIPMNFNLMSLNSYSNARDLENSINSWMDTMWRNHKIANWVLGNHDSSRVVDRLGRHKVDLMNIIVNALPGASVTYYVILFGPHGDIGTEESLVNFNELILQYQCFLPDFSTCDIEVGESNKGEEIGMSNVPTECTTVSCDNRDPERTPMQWTNGKLSGFTTGEKPWLPLAADFKRFNVQTERGVSRSTLHIFKALQQLKSTAAFKAFKNEGGFYYEALSQYVFQIIRTDTKLEKYRIIVNMGNQLEILNNLSNKTMEFVIQNSHSPLYNGDKIDVSGRFYMVPYEAIVLRWVAGYKNAEWKP